MKVRKQLKTYFASAIALTATAVALQGAVVTFQEGVDDYIGTQDTQLREASATTDHGQDPSVGVDQSDSDLPIHALIRFDNVFGNGPGQIPLGENINSATLTLFSTEVDAPSTDTINVHRMLQTWEESCTWASCFGGDGIQPNDSEALSTIDASFVPDFPAPPPTRMRTIDVTSAVAAWADGQPNFGWTLLPTGGGGYDIDSSERATTNTRPLLTIDFGEVTCPSFTEHPQSSNVVQGRSYTMSVEVTGTGPLSFQWIKDGLDILDATNSTYTITNMAIGDAGTYIVRASNDCGSTNSNPATVGFISDSEPPVFVRARADAAGTSVTLTFDEALDFAGGAASGPEDTFNYLIQTQAGGAGPIVATATRGADDMTVILGLGSALQEGVNYKVVLSDINGDPTTVCDPFMNCMAAGEEVLIPSQLQVMELDHVWRYLQDGTDQGTAWRETGFNDSGWPFGPGVLGQETVGTAVPLLMTDLMSQQEGGPQTIYFRAVFNLPVDPSEILGLRMRFLLDDGAVVHLNGQEAFRLGVPANQTFTTGASRTVGDADFEMTELPITNLVAGQNVIAVEVHQSGGNSSDIVWGAELFALVEDLPSGVPMITDHPQSQTVDEGSSVTFSVAATGALPFSFQWRKDGVNIMSATNSSFTIAVVSTDDEGAYDVVVSNAEGSDTSNPATLAVNPDTITPTIVSARADAAGTNVTVTFSEPLNFSSPGVGPEDPSNYLIQTQTGGAGPTVATAMRGADDMTVILDLGTPLQDDVNYKLVLSDINGDPTTICDPFGNCIPAGEEVIIPSELQVMQFNHMWRYLEDGTDQGTAWRDTGFNDTGWPSGLGVLGQETDGPSVALIMTDLMSMSEGGPRTTYFRAVFDLPVPPSELFELRMRFLLDDGAVVYLNGQEAFRVAVPADQTFATEGTRNVGNANFETTTLPTTNLVSGPNVIAVEVHQNGDNSSDIVWGAELFALVAAVDPDLTRPTVVSAFGSPDLTTITITFSEGMDPTSAQNTANYSLAPVGSGAGLAINSATLVDPTTVVLNTAARTFGQDYNLTISNVSDDAEALNVIDPNPTVVVIGSDQTILVPFDATWRYETANLNDTGWQTPAFNDTGWQQGQGLFGLETTAATLAALCDGAIRTPIALTNPTGEFRITYYFRTTVNVPAIPAGAIYVLCHAVDDGAVFYVDGVEVGSFNMTNSMPRYEDFAGPAGEASSQSLELSTLTPGSHVIAVEVHQSNEGSSDALFGAELQAVFPTSLTISRAGAGQVTLTWSDPSWILVASAEVTGPYTPIAGATSPFTTATTGTMRFFQLRYNCCP